MACTVQVVRTGTSSKPEVSDQTFEREGCTLSMRPAIRLLVRAMQNAMIKPWRHMQNHLPCQGKIHSLESHNPAMRVDPAQRATIEKAGTSVATTGERIEL